MNYLHVVIFVLYALVLCEAADIHRLKRTITSSRTSVDSDVTIPGYISYSTPYKYNEIQINPINGPPIQFRDVKTPFDQLPTADLSPDSLRQLQLLQYVSAYVPETDQLDESDFIPLLPYVDSISDDSLRSIQRVIGVSDRKVSSKISKIVNILLAIKEKKLKPIKKVVNVGTSLVHKKGEKLKNIVWKLTHPFSIGTTTRRPLVILPGPVSVLGDEPQPAYIPAPVAAPVPTVVDNRFVQFSGNDGGSYFAYPSLAPLYQSMTLNDQFSNQHVLAPRIDDDVSSIGGAGNDLAFAASENVEQTKYRESQRTGDDNVISRSTTEKNDNEKETLNGRDFAEIEHPVNAQIKLQILPKSSTPSAAFVYPETKNVAAQKLVKLTTTTNESNKVDQVQS